MDINRRRFNQYVVALAFGGLSKNIQAFQNNTKNTFSNALGYGDLISDPNGLLDLPKGFSYSVISSLGETMDDGLPVPDRADGMGCFAVGRCPVSGN